MTMAVPKIQVFAMFTIDPTSTEPPSWNRIHCLTFPLDTLNKLQFTRKPYKWIRYAAGVVVGAQGNLAFSRDSQHDVMDYDHDLRYESADLYYHISDAEKEKMFPADPDIGRTTGSSSATSLRADFRSDVVERDGACVLTNFDKDFCDAVHLLPHSKGNAYIETYTRRRSRDHEETDVLCDIDDIRNGILLNKIPHSSLGKYIAFLTTPNFAMTTADVDPTAQATEKRCTAHLFNPEKPEAFGDRTVHSGNPVRMPDTAAKWPPNILFDATYADAVLRHFATQTMLDTLEQWKSKFYPGRITSTAQAIIDEQLEATKAAERRKEQNQARDQRAAKRANRSRDDSVDFFDCLLILPHLVVPPGKQAEVRRKAAEKSVERERSRLEDKVVGWARDVANACP